MIVQLKRIAVKFIRSNPSLPYPGLVTESIAVLRLLMLSECSFNTCGKKITVTPVIFNKYAKAGISVLMYRRLVLTLVQAFRDYSRAVLAEAFYSGLVRCWQKFIDTRTVCMG